MSYTVLYTVFWHYFMLTKRTFWTSDNSTASRFLSQKQNKEIKKINDSTPLKHRTSSNVINTCYYYLSVSCQWLPYPSLSLCLCYRIAVEVQPIQYNTQYTVYTQYTYILYNIHKYNIHIPRKRYCFNDTHPPHHFPLNYNLQCGNK